MKLQMSSTPLPSGTWISLELLINLSTSSFLSGIYLYISDLKSDGQFNMSGCSRAKLNGEEVSMRSQQKAIPLHLRSRHYPMTNDTHM